jgi:hypothetical protein
MELHDFYRGGLLLGGCLEHEAESLARLLVELDIGANQQQHPVPPIFPF